MPCKFSPARIKARRFRFTISKPTPSARSAASGGISSNLLLWISATTNGVTGSSGNSVFTNTLRLACFITNLDLFAAEDWQTTWPGSVITNSLMNNQVYAVKLQFNQWAYPMALAQTNTTDAYGFYQLRTRVCRRALN